jgi:hypothetical protein
MEHELAPADTALDRGARRPHPVVFSLLIVPFGATSGFVGVALAFLATRVGLTVEDGAALIAVSLFPNVWKFFWAPVGDKTLTRKRWYLLGATACAVSMGAMATVPLGPQTLTLMKVIIALSSVAATFVGFSVEGMVAHLTPPEERGRVSGWFQAGNLGGSALGGALGLFLLTHLPSPWMAGTILAALTLACAIPLLWIPEVPADKGGETLGHTIRHIGTDLWAVIESRKGLLCAILCFVPVGTGAAGGVLTQAEVAAHWGAGDHEVELVQGLLTGIVSIIGCLLGGTLCSRLFNARVGYTVFGGLMAVVTALMAMAPANVGTYVGFSVAYAFATGLCYAAFSAFVLDAIGSGHAATKYNGFASLSNLPIWYMGLLLASAETKWGPSGMLWVESACGVLGIAVFAVLALALRERAPAAAPSVAT